MADIIQIRRDSSTNWTSVNPILAQGEEGYELDTGKRKVGDGVSAWSALSYAVAESAPLIRALDPVTGTAAVVGEYYVYTALSGNKTLILPVATTEGIVSAFNRSGSAYTVTVSVSGGSTISGQSSIVLNDGVGIQFTNDMTGWEMQ